MAWEKISSSLLSLSPAADPLPRKTPPHSLKNIGSSAKPEHNMNFMHRKYIPLGIGSF